MDTFVRFRDCTCPGTPHPEGDGVFLRPFLGFLAGAEVMRIFKSSLGNLEALNEGIGPVFLREGPIGWNLVDADGPIELDTEALLALPYEQGIIIVEAADELYSHRVLDPLVRGLAKSSATGPTNGTSATPRTSKPRRKPSSPSSPATSVGGESWTT